MSFVSDVIDLYLYDLEVSDEMFRRLLHDAIERDGATNPAALRALAQLEAVQGRAMVEEFVPGYSVKV